MGKDPAFLFYYQDFAYGTRKMTFEEKGIYIELLCEQADMGHLSLKNIKQILNNHFSTWDTISKKFEQDENGLFFNKVLENHINKRKEYVKSRKNNLMGSHMRSHMRSHMENVNVSVIKDGVEKKRILNNNNIICDKIEKKRILNNNNIICDKFVFLWNEFCDQNTNLVKILKLSNTRKEKINKRIKEKFTIDNFTEILTLISQSSFLKGYGRPRNGGEKSFKVSFDWIFTNDTNYVKILERKYNDDSPGIFRN